jgi:hypothetical protein
LLFQGARSVTSSANSSKKMVLASLRKAKSGGRTLMMLRSRRAQSALSRGILQGAQVVGQAEPLLQVGRYRLANCFPPVPRPR